MASVLLSTVGQAVGGPFGAGIGAAVGAGLDQARRPAGQANDLYQQQSAYGEAVPRLFGTMRMSGHLVWALPPATGRGRKGDGRREAEASFAIALSTGPVLRIGRIWADGRQIRSADGEMAFQFDMRLHSAPVRAADPLIAAAEGAEGAPALRGLSHLVFEGFPLGPFGNRIPNLSFELTAGDDGVSDWVRKMALDAGVGAGVIGPGREVAGFLAHSQPRSADLACAALLCGVEVRAVDGGLMVGGLAPSHEIPVEQTMIGREDGATGSRLVREEPPRGVSLTYIDPARDYQRSQQGVDRGRAGRQVQLNWAVAATSGAAAGLCRDLVRREEGRSDRLRLSLPQQWLHLSVGDEIAFAGRGRWRVIRREIRDLAVLVDAERIVGQAASIVTDGDSGRSLTDPVYPAGATSLVAFEPPVPMGSEGASLLIAGGGGPGWRGAEIWSLQSGDERRLGELPPGSAVGELLQPLAPGPDSIWDDRNAAIVRLFGQDSLSSRADIAVLNGAGLVLIGDELIQARRVDRIGDAVVRLSGLLRRRFATRCAAMGWPAGSPVAEIAGGELPRLEVRADSIGRTLVLTGRGRGDAPGGTEMAYTMSGAGISPLAPVHLAASREGGGAIRFRWMPRSRMAWDWGGAAMEAAQSYMLRLRQPGLEDHVLAVSGDSFVLTPGEQVAMSGGAILEGAFQVEAVGNGPAWLRCSSWCPFQ